MGKPCYFGIRHLSPAGAWHLRRLLEERRPKLILVEGPSDFDGLMGEIAGPETKPPIAVMAFTKESPIRTVLYPFAEYSPEYQAICWAKENRVPCRFIDLPTGVFLGISACREQQMEREAGNGEEQGNKNLADQPDQEGLSSERVYRLLDETAGPGGHENFWEHAMEHSLESGSYERGAAAFGRQLRELTMGRDADWPETLVREAYMRKQIEDAVSEGYAPEEIVVVTGAYHVDGLSGETPGMTEEEIKGLPYLDCNVTLMPYTYYRLSSRSGYGAGNQAPGYYGMLWQAYCEGDRNMAVYRYLTRISSWQRDHGFIVSSAEAIEAVRLAKALASLHGYETPSLRDLKDAAVTCMGHGSFSEIALASADAEIGSVVGSLPQGVSRTSLQDDFYRQLKDLRMEKYKSDIASTLELDLREKLNVKSQEAALRDLNRSFFLHRLRVLDVKFGTGKKTGQDNATWAEAWDIRWSPEVEIELVEAALKGDTVAQAASFTLKERAQEADGICLASQVIEEAFYCGMPQMVSYATEVLQKLAVDSAALEELAAAGEKLSVAMRFGSIRRLDASPLTPVLEQMFLRFCLLLTSACTCDDQGAGHVMESMDRINSLCLHHDFLDGERWIRLLSELASRDDINTRISGFAAAILMERGLMEEEELGREVHRRLSKGIPAELGAGWFAGLSKKNRYALIARLNLWRELSEYLDTLDDEEFKRALLFLRRAFADFTAREKFDIAENLAEIWQVNPQEAAEILGGSLGEGEMELLDSLDDFDFDSI